MKRYVTSVLAVVLVSILAVNAQAQRTNPNMGQNQQWAQTGNQPLGGRLAGILDLTPDQQTKIQEIRLNAQKAHLPVRNQIAEKQARLQTLRTAANYDSKEVNKIIEEIGVLRTGLAKDREVTRQEIRTVLTEDQRVIFDSMGNRANRGMGMKGGAGAGRNGGW